MSTEESRWSKKPKTCQRSLLIPPSRVIVTLDFRKAKLFGLVEPLAGGFHEIPYLLGDLLKQRYSSVEVGGGVDLQGAVPVRVPKVGVWVPLRRFVVVAGLGLNLKLLQLQLQQPDGN